MHCDGMYPPEVLSALMYFLSPKIGGLAWVISALV